MFLLSKLQEKMNELVKIIMYAAFVEVRFIKREKKVFDPIKKNSISLFRTQITKVAQQESQS